MDFHGCAITQNDVHPDFLALLQGQEDVPPQAFFAATVETLEDRMPVAVAFRKVPPGAAHAQDVKKRAKNRVVADHRRTAFPDIGLFNQGPDFFIKKLGCNGK